MRLWLTKAAYLKCNGFEGGTVNVVSLGWADYSNSLVTKVTRCLGEGPREI